MSDEHPQAPDGAKDVFEALARAQLDKYKAEREQLVTQANQQLAYLNGQIAALEKLLGIHPPPTPPSA